MEIFDLKLKKPWIRKIYVWYKISLMKVWKKYVVNI